MWSVEKHTHLYLLSTTSTCFIHKVKKTINLKSGLFSKMSKVVSYQNLVFRENKIRVRFSYRGGIVKIITLITILEWFHLHIFLPGYVLRVLHL